MKHAPQAAFEEYRNHAYQGEKLSQIQEQEIRRAFFAGMLCNFTAMIEISNVFDEDKASQMLEKLEAQLKEAGQREGRKP